MSKTRRSFWTKEDVLKEKSTQDNSHSNIDVSNFALEAFEFNQKLFSDIDTKRNEENEFNYINTQLGLFKLITGQDLLISELPAGDVDDKIKHLSDEIQKYKKQLEEKLNEGIVSKITSANFGKKLFLELSSASSKRFSASLNKQEEYERIVKRIEILQDDTGTAEKLNYALGELKFREFIKKEGEGEEVNPPAIIRAFVEGILSIDHLKTLLNYPIEVIGGFCLALENAKESIEKREEIIKRIDIFKSFSKDDISKIVIEHSGLLPAEVEAATIIEFAEGSLELRHLEMLKTFPPMLISGFSCALNEAESTQTKQAIASRIITLQKFLSEDELKNINTIDDRQIVPIISKLFAEGSLNTKHLKKLASLPLEEAEKFEKRLSEVESCKTKPGCNEKDKKELDKETSKIAGEIINNNKKLTFAAVKGAIFKD